jgi:hypothetical protein
LKKNLTFIIFILSYCYGVSQCTPVLNLPFTGNSLDISGNNNNAIQNGTPTLTADRFGTPNAAYDFGGGL